MSRDRLRCVFSLSTSLFFCSRLAVSAMYFFLQRVQVMQWMTLAEVQMKCLVILNNRLSPDIFSTLRIKEHVLRAFKSSGCSLVWNNALLTKKLPMFLSRNEINGGYETILPVSGSFEVI